MLKNICVFLILVILGCSQKQNEPQIFQELSPESSNVKFKNEVIEKDSINILDYLYFYNGGGVSSGDINNDGLVDLFFVSNQGENKLYLNKGNLKFDDISKKAKIEGISNWKTGVTMADVNNDGLLDIYVSAVSNYKSLKGHNELFINNGDLTFSEKSKEYGLAFQGFSTQAAFFDYDRDGDLDMYLLNHAVHTVSAYDKVSARSLRNNESGDFLYRNDGQKFTDVSEKAGIYGAAMGYGLGIAVADFNNDGWDDIYISNDFHEDDYYYINQKNGTFKEEVKSHFEHLSRFSMGNDASDINNDGFTDIFTTDMYPEDESIEKSSATEDPLDIYLFKLKFGFYKQFSRNALQLNEGGIKFTDIALMAGVAATDWSWSPLFADFDNDGQKDLFITNGIKRRPNNLDYIKYITDTTFNQYMTNEGMRAAMGPIAQGMRKITDTKAIDQMPDGKAHNYIFKGTKSLVFEDKSEAWGFGAPTYSNGSTIADLDNDGDQDIVTNDLMNFAKIYENKNIENKYLNIQFEGPINNKFGVGNKVFVFANHSFQYAQNHTSRGFMSSVTPTLHFGIPKNTANIDSILVVWPNQKMQVLKNIKPNQKITFKYANATANYFDFLSPKSVLFVEEKIDTSIFNHSENPYYDFSRESLMPFKLSTEGPKPAIGDLNGDKLDDIYLPSSKYKVGRIALQNPNGLFKLTKQPDIEADSLSEDVSSAFFDADNDGDLDLYVVSSGNEYFDKMTEQFDRLYLNDGKGNFNKSLNALPPMYSNKSCVKPFDYDNDGDLDLFIGGRVVPYHYGFKADSYLLQNNGHGIFKNITATAAPQFSKLGMVTDAVWCDVDNDKHKDLVVVGDWMPISCFKNTGKKLELTASPIDIKNTNGFWQTIEKTDIDNDGDIDLLVGNLGLNNKFIHEKNPSLKLFVDDFDNNGNFEQILAYSKNKNYYPVASKDELAKQLPSIINKKFTTYKDFAGKTVFKVIPNLNEEKASEINCFASVILINDGIGHFKLVELPREAQVSKIFSFCNIDYNNDKLQDIIIGGNFYNVSTYQGIYDGFRGLLLKNIGGKYESVTLNQSNLNFTGEVRAVLPIKIKQRDEILICKNNAPFELYSTTKNAVK